MNWPVESISNAFLRGIFLDNATIGVEQNSPMFTPFTPNRAVLDAMAISQLATNWHPAAVAMPCTFAITGWGILRIVVIIVVHLSNNILK